MVAMIAAACGPAGPTEAGGDAADARASLHILPSPGQLRGEPARNIDMEGLAAAISGHPDPELYSRLARHTLADAAVREWTGPNGQTLTTAISVWGSHVMATNLGGSAAELLSAEGGQAWTPRGLGGTRGSRITDPPQRREERLAYAVGPNSIYVRSTGPVPDDVVERTMTRLITYLRGTVEQERLFG